MIRKFGAAALIIGVACFGLASANAQESKSAPDAKVYFVNIKTGDTVSSPVLVQFGLKGMGVAPAGIDGELAANTGHHHLLVNNELKGDALKQPLPMDAKHVHFGKGQTEAMVTLPAGTHTLQLLLADWTHIPHNPPVMSERITITVK